VSPLLANLYLDTFDEELLDQGFRLVRFADDFVVLALRAPGGRWWPVCVPAGGMAAGTLGLAGRAEGLPPPPRCRLVTPTKGFHCTAC